VTSENVDATAAPAAATIDAVCSAVSTCGASTPATPRSSTCRRSASPFVTGRTTTGGGRAFRVSTHARIAAGAYFPCSPSTVTKSSPHEPSTEATAGSGIIISAEYSGPGV
jgi:hypothetical protein